MQSGQHYRLATSFSEYSLSLFFQYYATDKINACLVSISGSFSEKPTRFLKIQQRTEVLQQGNPPPMGGGGGEGKSNQKS